MNRVRNICLGVGKSCLLLRFCDDSWTPSFITTIGIDFKIRTIEVDGKRIKLQIVCIIHIFYWGRHRLTITQWDTAGQERFRTITTAYYRGSMGILIVFDLTDEKSFQSTWNTTSLLTHPPQMSAIGTKMSSSTQTMVHVKSWSATSVTGTKSVYVRLFRHVSGANPQVITTEQGQELANELGMSYIETSAKSNTNVDEAFFRLAQQVKDHLVDQGITSNVPGASGTQNINAAGISNTQNKGGCC